MAACFVSAHSIMDTPHFSGDTVHGARNRNVRAAGCRVMKNRMQTEIAFTPGSSQPSGSRKNNRGS